MAKKATGIVRRVDELGRIVIPMELRRTLGIADKESLEILVEGNQVILKVYRATCIFCGGLNDTMPYKEKMVCVKCRQDIRTESYDGFVVKTS